jgi:hypothetical protein
MLSKASARIVVAEALNLVDRAKAFRTWAASSSGSRRTVGNADAESGSFERAASGSETGSQVVLAIGPRTSLVIAETMPQASKRLKMIDEDLLRAGRLRVIEHCERFAHLIVANFVYIPVTSEPRDPHRATAQARPRAYSRAPGDDAQRHAPVPRADRQ